MAYATPVDVTPLLGDLELPSTLNVQTFLDRSAMEIDLALGARYILPLSVTDSFTSTLLKVVNSELAAAMIFLAQASGGEDNRINAYGEHLWQRAMARLMSYLADDILPGNVVRPDGVSSEGTAQVALFQKDLVSGVDSFYNFVQGRTRIY